MIPLLATDCSEFLGVVTTNFCVTVVRSVHRLTPPVSSHPPLGGSSWPARVVQPLQTPMRELIMLTRLLGLTQLDCGCLASRYRDGALERDVRYVEDRGAGWSTPRPSTSPGRDLSAPPQRDAAPRARRLTPRNLLLHRGPACVCGGDSHDHSPSSDRHARRFAFIMPTLLSCSTDYPRTRLTSS